MFDHPFKAIPEEKPPLRTFGRRVVAMPPKKSLRLMRFKRKLPEYLQNTVFIAGLGMITAGCWLAWHPLGWLIGGTCLVLVAILMTQERNESR